MAASSVAAQDEEKDAGAGPRKSYWSLRAGGFDGEDVVGPLEDPGSGTVFGGGYGRRFNRYLAGEAQVLISGQEYKAPLLSDDDLTLEIISILYSLKASVPLRRVEPFFTVGVGIHQANIQEVNVPTGLFESVGVIEFSEDRGFVSQFGVGIDIRLGGKSSIGFEFRETDAEADFGALTGGDVDIGGSMVLFVYRRDFGRLLSGR